MEEDRCSEFSEDKIDRSDSPRPRVGVSCTIQEERKREM